MIGHDDKLVQKESPLFAIMRQREKQESGGRVPTKDRQTAVMVVMKNTRSKFIPRSLAEFGWLVCEIRHKGPVENSKSAHRA